MLDHSGGPNVFTRVLLRGLTESEKKMTEVGVMVIDLKVLLAFKIEEGHQESRNAVGSWKRQRILPQISRGMWPSQQLGLVLFSPVKISYF